MLIYIGSNLVKYYFPKETLWDILTKEKKDLYQTIIFYFRYPWKGDQSFQVEDVPYKPPYDNHPLIRSRKYSPEFIKLNNEVKMEILKEYFIYSKEYLEGVLKIPE